MLLQQAHGKKTALYTHPASTQEANPLQQIHFLVAAALCGYLELFQTGSVLAIFYKAKDGHAL